MLMYRRRLPRRLRLQREPPDHHRLPVQQRALQQPALRGQRRADAVRGHRRHLRLVHLHAGRVPDVQDGRLVRGRDAVPADRARGRHVDVVQAGEQEG